MAIEFLNRNSRILCIDDSKLNRAIIKKTISNLNISVDEAENGLEGLNKFKKNSYDLIIVDIVMPVMDGFEFIKEFKKLSGKQYIPVILMTGLEDLNSKIKGLNIGADDYLLKPVNEKELIARVMSLLRLRFIHAELYKKNYKIEMELEAAQKIQRFIVPENFDYIDYPKIYGRYQPIDNVGGDFFDSYKISDSKTAFVMADVTGHGIPAALTMTMTKMLFTVNAPKYISTSALLKIINRDISGTIMDNQFITAFYLIHDKNKNTLTFSNAGHTRALLYRSEKKHIVALDAFGLFLGISSDIEYEQKEVSINKGDRLFLYTDGLTEIRDETGDEFGEKRLAKYIKNNHAIKGEKFCNELLLKITDFDKKNMRNDDMAFMIIEF